MKLLWPAVAPLGRRPDLTAEEVLVYIFLAALIIMAGWWWMRSRNRL